MKFSRYNLVVPDKNRIVLFNTLQGHCIEIDKDTANKIKDNQIDKLEDDVKQIFIQYGIIINDNVDESRIFSYFHSHEKYSSNSINSTVLLTWACNLKCVYCFEGEKTDVQSMSKEQANRYIEFIIKLATIKKAENVMINLFGGEPLVNIEIGFYILEKIMTYCNENAIYFSSSIITNGTLINEAILDKLLSFNCKSIQITLDGIKEIHDSRRIDKQGKGSFDKIIDVLKMLNMKVGDLKTFNTVIRINIDKINIGATYELLNYIGKNGLDLTNCTVDFGIVRGLTESCAAYSSNCFVEGEIGSVLYDLWKIVLSGTLSESSRIKLN